MKLYDSAMAPNPRRVRIFLAEKGISVPTAQVDIGKRETRQPEFLAKNPLGGVPVLELDDGRFLCESVAICRYFEERRPQPPLFGVDATDRAFVEMWQRRMESEVFLRVTQTFQNTHDFFKGRIEQVPAFGEVRARRRSRGSAWLDGELAGREFIAGDRYTHRRHHRAVRHRLRPRRRHPHRPGLEEPPALARGGVGAPEREGMKRSAEGARSEPKASGGRNVKRRSLGRTGLTVSEICLGTMTFGSMADEKTAHRCLDRPSRRASTSSTSPRCIRCRRIPRRWVSARRSAAAGWPAARATR